MNAQWFSSVWLSPVGWPSLGRLASSSAPVVSPGVAVRTTDGLGAPAGVDSLIVGYRGPSQLTAERLRRLRAAAHDLGVGLRVLDTLPLGESVVGIDQVLAGSRLDELSARLRAADPSIVFITPNTPVTVSRDISSLNDPKLESGEQWSLREGAYATRARTAWGRAVALPRGGARVGLRA